MAKPDGCTYPNCFICPTLTSRDYKGPRSVGLPCFADLSKGGDCND